MIRITSLNKFYKSKKSMHHALKDVFLDLPDKGLVFVLGKSGSGKSTFLNLIGGLDKASSGRIVVDGNDISGFNEKKFVDYRNSCIGFIFQDHHLIDDLTVYQNIKLALDLKRIRDDALVSYALEQVGLAGYGDRFPRELSGGERQRVAIARAIVKRPRIILADEPTGNLDGRNAAEVMRILKELSKDCLVLTVSHNTAEVRANADRIIELSDGRIISDMTRNPDYKEEAVLENDTIMKYTKVSTMDMTLGGETVQWHNTNAIVDPTSAYYCPYAIGMKTGKTPSAGSCLLTVFTYGEHTWIIGVFGCATDESRFEDTLQIFNKAYKTEKGVS